MTISSSKPKYSLLDLGYDRLLIKGGSIEDAYSDIADAAGSSQESSDYGGPTGSAPSLPEFDDVTPQLQNVITDGQIPSNIIAGEMREYFTTRDAGVSGQGTLGSSIRLWAGSDYENRATAAFRVDQDGNLFASSVSIDGIVLVTVGSFGGDGSDGALTVSSGTTTIDLGSSSFVTKNYSSISITGTGAVAFSNPASGGTTVVFKCQGAYTITSSATRAIDMRNLGGVGGTGGSGAQANNGHGGGGGASASTAGSVGGTGYNNGGNATAGTGYGRWVTGITQTGGGPGNAAAGVVSVTGGFSSGAAPFIKAFLTPGSGGGGGGQGAATNGGDGGRGAGALIVECGGAYNVTGTLDFSGTAGGSGSGAQGGGGGGGGAGSYSALYNELTADTGTYTVTGGAAGTGNANGGDGGAGFSSVAKNTTFA